MRKFVELTVINFQEWNTFLGFKTSKKDSTIGRINIETSKIVSFSRVTPRDPDYMYKDYPKYTQLKVLGRKSPFHIVETPAEIKEILKNI